MCEGWISLGNPMFSEDTVYPRPYTWLGEGMNDYVPTVQSENIFERGCLKIPTALVVTLRVNYF